VEERAIGKKEKGGAVGVGSEHKPMDFPVGERKKNSNRSTATKHLKQKKKRKKKE
jgi:hypothetical protein